MSKQRDKMQQNRCRLCGDRNQTINCIISECYKLAQRQYLMREEWVGKVIHSELYKKFNFGYSDKWYMPRKGVAQNSFGFCDHLISVRRPELVIVKKWTSQIMDFATPVDRRIKLKESEKRDMYLDLTGKKKWNMTVKVIPIGNGTLVHSSKD